MSRAENKATRLRQIEALLLDHPQGMTQAELARRLGVHRSTIQRNVRDLEAPVYEEGGRLFVKRDAYLVNLHLTLHEALSVHLAGRLMATQMDRQNPHAAAALRKLGLSLQALAPQISRFIRTSANGLDDESKRTDPHYLQVVECLTDAWAGGQKTRLWYRSSPQGGIKTYCFLPYFIEVGAFGYSIYAYGQIEPSGERRTFKMERIERVELLAERYSLPVDFDPDAVFGRSWGIWVSENEPVEVALRFSARVAQRVRETRWHRSEQVVEQEDGSLLWTAWIAEPKEMMPWVRGWGAEVEVLRPEGMREMMERESQNLFNIYHLEQKLQPGVQRQESRSVK